LHQAPYPAPEAGRLSQRGTSPGRCSRLATCACRSARWSSTRRTLQAAASPPPGGASRS